MKSVQSPAEYRGAIFHAVSIQAGNPLCFLRAAMPESDQPTPTPPTYSSKTLFEAPPYDPAKERKQKIKITIIVAVIVVLAVLIWVNRYWPQEHQVSQFFSDLQKQDYKAAYGVWMHDPNWQQHPEKYSRYPFNEFYRDWGPGGEWGLIHSFKVLGAIHPKNGSGVVVGVEVNGRVDQAHVWVEKSDKTLNFSPY
jgi:hypothetical protein